MTSCLVIDDDALFRTMAADVLTAHRFTVTQASTGREGLEAFKAQPTDVVLLDLVLPDISGYEVLQQLAGPNQNCRVIVTTSFFTLDSALKVLRQGAGDYLPKPFSEEMLLMSVERVLKRLSLERQNQELSMLLRLRINDLNILHQISLMVTSNQPIEVWMDEAIRASCHYIGAQAGSLLLLDTSTDELVFNVTTGPSGEKAREKRLPRGKGIAWYCLEHRQPVKVDDVTADPRFVPSVFDWTGYSTRNLVAVPVVVRDECIGVIELVNREGAPCFRDEDLERLQELSGHIAVAVQNVLTIRDLQRSREELVNWSRKLEQIVEERTRALKEVDQSRQIAMKALEQSQRAMKRAQGTLVEREKVAALGMLAAGVAHEINNPLGFVNANLSVLEQYVRALRRLAGVVLHAQNRVGTGQNDTVARLLEETGRIVKEDRIREVVDDLGPLLDEMSNGVARITWIVEQLRTFAEDGDLDNTATPVDLNSEVGRLVELVQGADGGIFKVDLAATPPVQVPLKVLRQALLNLLSYFVQNRGGGQPMVLRTHRDGPGVVLSMLDPGSKLTDEEVGKVFDPFFDPGHGLLPGQLGLSAAYGSARAMGGSLQARRAPEGGVQFQMMLPCGDGGSDGRA